MQWIETKQNNVQAAALPPPHAVNTIEHDTTGRTGKLLDKFNASALELTTASKELRTSQQRWHFITATVDSNLTTLQVSHRYLGYIPYVNNLLTPTRQS